MIPNDNIQLYHGDCLEIMKDIPDKSIDMILCDLPYGTTECKWDSVIPFELLWEQYNRLIKDNGAIVLFGSEPFSTLLRSSNLKMYKYDWIWIKEKAPNFPNAKNQPLKIHELISVFSKGNMIHISQTNNRMVYNPQNLQPININITIKKSHRKSEGYLGSRDNQIGKTYSQKYTNYPNTLLRYNKDKEKLHPTQKPVPLLEYLIKTYTNENENAVVLDNCMGSGSTGVACINTNRKFIGIELDDKYFEIAKERIENTCKNKI